MAILTAVLLALALIVMQLMFGGAARPALALPGLALVAVVGILAGAVTLFRRRLFIRWWCLGVTLVFGAWLVFRAATTPDTWLAPVYERLILGCLVTYLVVAVVLNENRARFVFWSLVAVFALVQAGLGMVQFLQRAPDFGQLRVLADMLIEWEPMLYVGRARGFYWNANHLAWLLNTVALLALAVAVWGRVRVGTRIVVVWVAACGMGAGLLCVSRGGLLGMIGGLAVFLVLSVAVLKWGAEGTRWRAALVVVVGLLAVLGVLWWVLTNNEAELWRFSLLFKDPFRPNLWEAGVRQFQLEPLIGTGAGTFLYYSRMFRTFDAAVDDVYAHNDWIQIAADFGFVGLVLAVLVVGTHGRAAVRGIRSALRGRLAASSRIQSTAVAFQVGALAVLGACVVHSFFDFNMQIPANALLAAALLGVLAGGPATGGTPVFLRVTIGLVLLAVSTLLGLAVVRDAPGEWRWLRAEAAMRRGDFAGAEAEARAGLLVAPRHHRLFGTLADALLATSRQSTDLGLRWRTAWAAAENARKAVEFGPLEKVHWLGFAEGLAASDRHEAAREAAARAIALEPRQGRPYEVYAIALLQGGRWDDGIRALEVAVQFPGPARRAQVLRALKEAAKGR